MGGHIVAFSSLLLGSAFLIMAAGLNGLLMPVRGAIEGFTTTELGLMGTGWAVGFIAATLLVPAIVGRVGHVRGYGALASLAAVSILACAMVITPVTWIILRILTGFCFAGAAMIVESWINEKTPSDSRGQVFSLYQMVHFGASTVGQFLLALRPPTDFFFFALAAIFYCLAILPTALSTTQSPRPLRTTRLNLLGIYRNCPVSAVGCVLIGMANGAFGSLGPVYAQQIGLAVRDIAILMAVALLGGSLVQFPLGWVSDRTDRRRVLMAIAVGAAAVGAAIAILQLRSGSAIIVLAAMYGMLTYPMWALMVAHANDFAEPDNFVGIAGGLLLLYGLGTAAGPLLGSVVMSELTPDALFAFTATVHVLLAGYAAFRVTRRNAPDQNLRGSFHGLPMPKGVTPESAALDPRSEGPQDDE